MKPEEIAAQLRALADSITPPRHETWWIYELDFRDHTLSPVRHLGDAPDLTDPNIIATGRSYVIIKAKGGVKTIPY